MISTILTSLKIKYPLTVKISCQYELRITVNSNLILVYITWCFTSGRNFRPINETGIISVREGGSVFIIQLK